MRAKKNATGAPRPVIEGLGALHWARDVLEKQLSTAKSHENGNLLLALRDIEGLIGRLESGSASDWASGHMALYLSGQDLGVMKEWEERSPLITHSKHDPDTNGSWQVTRQFKELREYLEMYAKM